MVNSNCWVQFWDADYFDDRKNSGSQPNTEAKHYHKYDGPKEEKYLEENHWPGNPHNNENNEYSSLITGPNAWLEVHADRDNLGESYLFEPNSRIYELSSIPRNNHGGTWNNCITSFRIYDRDPRA